MQLSYISLLFCAEIKIKFVNCTIIHIIVQLMKKIYCAAVIFLILSPFMIKAEKSVTLELKNGSKEVVLLSDGPKISFEESTLKITSAKITKSIERENVKKITIGEDSGVDIVTDNASQIKWNFVSDGKIEIHGLKPYEKVSVFSVAGMMKAQVTANDSGICSLDISDLASDIYLIKTNKSTFKIIK